MCVSQHHITNAKQGWESPRIKRIQAPETGDGALLLSSSDRSKRSQTGITVHNTCTKTHKTVFFFFLSSFSKEGCTRACMGQLEHNRPCALCHYNFGGEASVVPFQAPLLTLHSCAGRGQHTCQPGNALTGTSKARLPPYARRHERKMPFVTPEE